MIKKYSSIYDEDMQDSFMEVREDGNYYKVKDVEDLLITKIEKLSLKNDDVVTIIPPDGVKWSEEKCYQYYRFLNNVLEHRYHNLTFTFAESVKIEVSSQESNDTNEADIYIENKYI
jgi:hypothetical protein